MENPLLILLFSGKRKSGKDYVTDTLIEKLDSKDAVVLKISAPIKTHWAKTYGLSLDELMSAGSLKETFRRQMIEWSEEVRKCDPGIFCQKAIEIYRAVEKPIWIVSDVRRKTDIAWFNSVYPGKVITVRVSASEGIRKDRGWIFTEGIDDAATECDLDDFDSWKYTVKNNLDPNTVEDFVNNMLVLIRSKLKK